MISADIAHRPVQGGTKSAEGPSDNLRTLLAPVLGACPLQAGSLYTSYKDLALSVEWHDLRTLVLPGTEWAIILGHKKRDDPLRAVVPLPLHTTSLRPSALKAIFSSLATLPLSAVPSTDAPLIPTVEEVQREMERRRKERDGDTSPAVVDIAETAPLAEKQGVNEGSGTGEVNGEIERETIYLAITTSDSTVVYYKLTKGIRKPADIPDE